MNFLWIYIVLFQFPSFWKFVIGGTHETGWHVLVFGYMLSGFSQYFRIFNFGKYGPSLRGRLTFF